MALSASGSGASRSVVYRLIADATGVLAGTRQASAAMKKLGDDVTAVSKEGEKTRKGFDNIGRTAGRIGLVAAAGLGIAIAKAANFEQSMSNVAAATHESEQNMGLLRDAAIDAGARTQYSATQAADAITELAKAGVSTADILGKKGALNGALNLAAAGQLEVKDAAEDMATALSQFKLPGTQAAHVADLLAAGAGKAQGEVADMANALKYAGVPASNLGVSIEETAGTIALFAKNGIIGEQAGTSLRGMLSSLTSPSKIAGKTLDNLGISVFNQKGKFVGLAGVADQLRSNMKGLTDEERANALGKIFGNEQLQAANVLYREGSKGVEAWKNNVDDAGFAADTARIKTDNLRGDLERLGGALDTLLIQGGSGSQGPLRGLVQGLTKAVDVAGKLPPSLSNAAGGMAAITAITGGGLWFSTKVIRGVADTREALQNLGDSGKYASKGLKLAAAAGAGFTAALVTVEVIKAIQRATDEALPGLNTMKKRLIEIADTGSLASLGTQFDDVAGSIDRLGQAQEGVFSDSFGRVNLTGLSDAALTPFGLQARSLRDASQEVDALDQALAALVSSGKPDVAAQAITNIAQASGLTTDQMATLRANLPAYQDALDGMETSAQQAGDKHVGMGKKIRVAGQDIHFTAQQIEDAQKLYDDQRKAAGEIADQFLDISKNVDKAKVSLGKWLDGLVKQQHALEEFTANSKKALKRGLNETVVEQLKGLGPAGALRLKQLAEGTQDQIDRTNKVFGGLAKARDAFQNTVKKPIEIRTNVKVIDDEARRKERALRQKFATFPKTVNTELKWDNRAADRGLDHVEARLARLREQAVIKLRVAQLGEHNDQRLGVPTFASGGSVRGPGTGTSDSIPAYLSNGEYVVKAAAVARYGSAFFDRLNAMRFASGGPVGATSTGGGLTRADLEYIAANMRPLIGHADVQVKNYDDLKRLDGQVRRASFSTGWGG